MSHELEIFLGIYISLQIFGIAFHFYIMATDSLIGALTIWDWIYKSENLNIFGKIFLEVLYTIAFLPIIIFIYLLAFIVGLLACTFRIIFMKKGE